MTDYIQKQCPKCGQQLRFPEDIGGVLMVCPSCGNKFRPDFKLGVAQKSAKRNLFMTIFEMPDKILRRIGRLFSSR